MTLFRLTPVALALGATCAGAAFAQPTAPGADTALTLGQVVVSSGASGPLEARRLLTSVDISPPSGSRTWSRRTTGSSSARCRA